MADVQTKGAHWKSCFHLFRPTKLCWAGIFFGQSKAHAHKKSPWPSVELPINNFFPLPRQNPVTFWGQNACLRPQCTSFDVYPTPTNAHTFLQLQIAQQPQYTGDSNKLHCALITKKLPCKNPLIGNHPVPNPRPASYHGVLLKLF